jgi:hypothetical protein
MANTHKAPAVNAQMQITDRILAQLAYSIIELPFFVGCE